MRFNITILIAMILAVSLCSTAVLALDPLKKDDKFLFEDPDHDLVVNRDEFRFGTDPFNSDSDNDGLPDGWELEYYPRMNPADSSDAHEDIDYDPSSNGTGYNIGERDATFDAVKTLAGGQPVTWPSDPDVLFTQPVFSEEGPHYDNYEEYYRPYTDLENQNVIRYMHTDPTKSDTDGDAILDPDDYEPLGWKNDGMTPGALDIPEKVKSNPLVEITNSEVQEVALQLADYDIEPNGFDIIIEQTKVENVPPSNDDKKYLPDLDNDGI